MIGASLVSGCQRDDTTHAQSFPAIGTLVSIEIQGVSADRADRATTATQTYLSRIGRDWYAWGDGELAHVNEALMAGAPAPASAELAALIRRALEIRALSAGYFDPTLGLLIEQWGFHDSSFTPDSPPPAGWLAAWQTESARRDDVAIVDNIVRAPVSIKLALGGIAKGTALLAIKQILRDQEIEHALVDAGGDVLVIGSKHGRKWRIGIRDPHSPGIVGIVALDSGEAVLSSGDYERFFEQNGQRYHHLLDPHTARPVAHTAGVTVIHEDAELADAAATALMAAGPQKFEQLAARMEIHTALLVTSDGIVMTTPAMRGRLDTSEHNRSADF